MGFFDFRRRKLLKAAQDEATKLLTATVHDIMTDYVVTIPPEKCVLDAAAIMIGEDVSTVVIEQNDKPLGVLTERNFINDVPASSEALCIMVKKVMSKEIKSIAPEAKVIDALAKMKQEQVRKLIVLRPDGSIGGIMTQTDISTLLYKQLHTLARIDSPLLVKEIMTKEIISIPVATTFPKAKALMTKHAISALPLTDKGVYVGMLTEYDIVAQYYDESGKLKIKKLSEIMKGPIKVVPSELNIFDANMIMLFEHVRRLIVLEDGKPVGIVTQTDIVRAAFAYIEKMAAYLVENGAIVREDHFITLRDKTDIISEYAGNHFRAYTVKT